MTLTRILLYARDVEATVRFYETHFGFAAVRQAGDRIVELVHPEGGANLMVHPAAKSQRQGQSQVKLVFSVGDIQAFCAASDEKGLIFGPVHAADGYGFANARDPDGNPISISGRGTTPAS